jgi:4-hydroxy-tetrahydrodipicolinate synthase
MSRELRGILSAIVTPFTADGSKVDQAGLRNLVEANIQGGVHGIIPCGSTGEFPSLSTEERKRVTEIVVDQARGRVPVVPQTGSDSTTLTIDLSRHAEKVGAEAVMVLPPYSEPLGLDDVYGYYKDISNAISIPIMVYNYPYSTGVNLKPSFVARMAREIENVKYVKESSGDLAQVSELLYEYGDAITVFNGWGKILYPSLVLGCKGTAWGAVSPIPEQCANLFNLVQAGKFVEARDLWIRMWPVLRFFAAEGFNQSVKAAATLMGFQVGPPRPPLRPLSPEKTQELRGLLLKAGFLEVGK